MLEFGAVTPTISRLGRFADTGAMAVDMVKYRSDFVPVYYGSRVQAVFTATTRGCWAIRLFSDN